MNLIRFFDKLFGRFKYKHPKSYYEKKLDTMPKEFVTYGKMPEGKDTWIFLDKPPVDK